MAPDTSRNIDSRSAREEILSRIRQALTDVPSDEDYAAPRTYLRAHGHHSEGELIDLLADNLSDYRAHVYRTTEPELTATIARILADRGSRSVLTPPGVPDTWLAQAESEPETELIAERDDHTHADLDAIDSVVTTCAIAIAETGTIVLTTGPGQGKRRSTLIPDHHICVIRVPEQVVASVPQALERLDATQAQTWIAGPSATSDIELDRVEGVHGPRLLDVILVRAAAEA